MALRGEQFKNTYTIAVLAPHYQEAVGAVGATPIETHRVADAYEAGRVGDIMWNESMPPLGKGEEHISGPARLKDLNRRDQRNIRGALGKVITEKETATAENAPTTPQQGMLFDPYTGTGLKQDPLVSEEQRLAAVNRQFNIVGSHKEMLASRYAGLEVPVSEFDRPNLRAGTTTNQQNTRRVTFKTSGGRAGYSGARGTSLHGDATETTPITRSLKRPTKEAVSEGTQWNANWHKDLPSTMKDDPHDAFSANYDYARRAKFRHPETGHETTISKHSSFLRGDEVNPDTGAVDESHAGTADITDTMQDLQNKGYHSNLHKGTGQGRATAYIKEGEKDKYGTRPAHTEKQTGIRTLFQQGTPEQVEAKDWRGSDDVNAELLGATSGTRASPPRLKRGDIPEWAAVANPDAEDPVKDEVRVKNQNIDWIQGQTNWERTQNFPVKGAEGSLLGDPLHTSVDVYGGTYGDTQRSQGVAFHTRDIASETEEIEATELKEQKVPRRETMSHEWGHQRDPSISRRTEHAAQAGLKTIHKDPVMEGIGDATADRQVRYEGKHEEALDPTINPHRHMDLMGSGYTTKHSGWRNPVEQAVYAATRIYQGMTDDPTSIPDRVALSASVGEDHSDLGPESTQAATENLLGHLYTKSQHVRKGLDQLGMSRVGEQQSEAFKAKQEKHKGVMFEPDPHGNAPPLPGINEQEEFRFE